MLIFIRLYKNSPVKTVRGSSNVALDFVVSFSEEVIEKNASHSILSKFCRLQL